MSSGFVKNSPPSPCFQLAYNNIIDPITKKIMDKILDSAATCLLKKEQLVTIATYIFLQMP